MNVLLIYNFRSKFVEIDCNLLSHKYNLTEHDIQFKSYMSGFLQIFKNDTIIFWFINYRTLPFVIIAKLLKKKVCVISGGYDISNIKGYGMFSTFFGKLCQKTQFLLSNLIMVNSKSSYNELLSRIPKLKTKLFWEYHALDSSPNIITKTEKDIDFITVGFIKKINMKRKGYNKFIDLAKKYPLKTFYFIGRVLDKELVDEFPSNIILTGYLSEQEKNNLLLRSKFYFQYSLHEGFGLSVLEAQMFGCYILYNPVFALNEVVKYGEPFKFDLDLPKFKKRNSLHKELPLYFNLNKRLIALESLIQVNT